jgi:hypothetical protein
MDNNIVPSKQAENSESPFDSIRRFDEKGQEYWLARELQKILGYIQWRRFEDAIDRAKISLQNQGVNITAHVAEVGKLPSASNPVPLQDYKLSRHACYTIAMNGDVRKPEIAQAQAYFATKTREAEVAKSSQLEPEERQLYAEAPRQLPPVRDAIDYANATETVKSLPDCRLKRLLEARIVAELSIDVVNQKQLGAIEPAKNYTTATVRAAQLGYSAKQIGSGASLGKFVKLEIAPDFEDWQGQFDTPPTR